MDLKQSAHLSVFLAAAAAGCTSTSGTASDAASTVDTSAVDGTTTGDGTVTPIDCSTATTQLAKSICVANGFLATLSATERAAVNLAFTDSASRTEWSNLPGVTRAGAKMGTLSASSQAAALQLMTTVLSPAGDTDLLGVRAADDYLGTLSTGGGGPGGGSGGAQYSSDNYTVAIFGTPSATGSWEIMFGGHHMAYNIAFVGGVGYPVPDHLGVEPKAPFTINGGTYQPMSDESAALVGLFGSLSTAELASAYLQGQTFSDVLIGPVEYGTGRSALAKAKFPTGANRLGVTVSSLTAPQQALVTAAITAWVGDYDPAIADSLLAAYTSSAAYADTLISWGGTQSAGPDIETDGTYFRIDGPRAWIEVACQGGIVIQGVTHFHSIYRDKSFDYAGTL